MAQVRFVVFPQFNDPVLAGMVRSTHRLGDVAREVFTGDRRQDRFVRALADRRVLNTKEVLESFAFHHRVRRRVRQPEVVDLCCGHGLTGALFALLEPTVERVVLVDHRRPQSVSAVLDALAEVDAAAAAKVCVAEVPLEGAAPHVPAGAGVIGVHACGLLTDGVLDLALAAGGPVAVMPCCYPKPRGVPPGVKEALGGPLAVDVHRSYRLQAAGLRVDWASIPSAITPMSRVLIGWRAPGDG